MNCSCGSQRFDGWMWKPHCGERREVQIPEIQPTQRPDGDGFLSMTTVAHALSAALIAVTAMKVPPSESRYLVAALVAGAIADADHVYPVLRDWRFYRQNGFRGNLHGARTPVHELAGLAGAAVITCLLWWIDPLMAGVVFAAFAVHLAQDFVTGHSLPMNPADMTVVRMFDLSFKQKVAIDAAVIATSIALWIPYLRGRG
jgi:hypothetical protein